MSLTFLGKDPESEHGGSPTVWEEDDCYVIQGWKVNDVPTLAAVGDVPSHETVLRIPKRMLQFFPEVNGGGIRSTA